MAGNGPKHRVVVGVDGSASSLEALRWAVRQAELTGATVDAVIAWQYPPHSRATGGEPK
jgi:nucleotide-binding universal stress UspA family protein